MISIFNGKSRGIGQSERQEVYVKVSVTLRAHLHRFKGAKLGVFLAIALHSDADGWASPSVKVLRAETGYNPHTIADALTELCDTEIDGQCVLLAVQERKGGAFTQNRYLVFPSAEELAKYVDSSALRKPRRASEEPDTPTSPSVEKRHTANGKPSVEKLHTAKTAIQGSRTRHTGDSPSVGKASAENMYGSKTIRSNHGGGGDRARESNGRAPETTDPLVALFAHYDITQAEPLARLYREKWPDMTIDQLTRLCEHLSEPDAGSYAGARLYRKLKAGPYERRPIQPEPAPDRSGRPAVAARGKHAPSGGAAIRDPGWQERELARIQREYNLSDADITPEL